MKWNVVPKYLLKCQNVKWNKSYDEKNFLYCVIQHLWPSTRNIEHSDQIPSKFIRKLNLQGVSFPIQFKQIKRFVLINDHLPMTIRVLFVTDGEICVLDIFSNIKNKKKRYKNVLNILMLKSDQNRFKASQTGFPSSISTVKELNHQHHFFRILKLDAFLNRHEQHVMKSEYCHKRLFCEVCLMHFTSEEKRESHRQVCQQDKQKVLYVEKGAVVRFKNQKNKFKAPVIGFADFECYMESREDDVEACQKCNRFQCDCEKSSSRALNNHRACGFSICFVDSDNDVFYQETYGGKDAVEVFLNKLSDYGNIVHERKQRFRSTTQIVATQDEWFNYHQAEVCHICNDPFQPDSRKYKKVVDHDHVSGSIIQAAHSICNLQRQGPYKTPIYFHNAQG